MLCSRKNKQTMDNSEFYNWKKKFRSNQDLHIGYILWLLVKLCKCSILPLALYLILWSYLHPIGCLAGGRLVRVNVLFSLRA